MFRILEKIKSKIDNTIGKYQYFYYSQRNFYRCKLVGEKPSRDENDTIIIYRILGKRDIFEIPIQELLLTPDLLSQFHPTEAIKFGAISMGDVLLRIHDSKRREKFDEIKKKMMDSTRG